MATLCNLQCPAMLIVPGWQEAWTGRLLLAGCSYATLDPPITWGGRLALSHACLIGIPDPNQPQHGLLSVSCTFPTRYTGSDICAGLGLGTRLVYHQCLVHRGGFYPLRPKLFTPGSGGKLSRPSNHMHLGLHLNVYIPTKVDGWGNCLAAMLVHESCSYACSIT